MHLKKALMKGLVIAMVMTPALNTSSVFAQGETIANATTETVKNGLQSDGTYYENGTMKTGLITINGQNYYFDETTGIMKRSTWVNDSYFNASGIRLENGDYLVRGTYHYYFVNGVKVVNTWEGNAYYGSDGKRYENGQYTIDGETYYFKDGAKVISTWVNDQYYDASGALLKSAYAAKDDTNLYLDANGDLATGMFHVNNAYAYFTKGVKSTATKWFKYNGKYYYLISGNAATGLKKIGKYYYYFASNGVLKTGFVKVGKNCYYFKKTGKAGTIGRALTGLFKVNGSYYYGNSKGVLTLSKTLKIKNKKYTFNKNGKCTKVSAVKKLYGMDAKAQSYSSPTKYLILVNKSSHTVAIYKGSKNNWKKVKSFLCTVGKASTPTTSGVFHIGQTKGKYVKARYFDSYPSRCWYPTRIHDGYMFHSVLYKISSTPSALNDGRLGQNLSHGCIRLALANAKYIHDVIPAGTTVVIY